MADNSRHGKIFFAVEPVDGWEQWEELALDSVQSEQFIDTVLDSGVFDGDEILEIFALPESTKIFVDGWTFTRRTIVEDKS